MMIILTGLTWQILKIVYSSSVKNIIGDLIGIALNLYITLGNIVI